MACEVIWTKSPINMCIVHGCVYFIYVCGCGRSCRRLYSLARNDHQSIYSELVYIGSHQRTPTEDVAALFFTTVVSYMVLPLSRKWSMVLGGASVVAHLVTAPTLAKAQKDYIAHQVSASLVAIPPLVVQCCGGNRKKFVYHNTTTLFKLTDESTTWTHAPLYLALREFVLQN